MVLEALVKQGESHGCLKPSYVLGPTLWHLSGEEGYSKEGAKREKISNKDHHRNQHNTTVLYFIYSRLLLSRHRRDHHKHFEISVFRHIRFVILRKKQFEQPNFTNDYVI